MTEVDIMSERTGILDDAIHEIGQRVQEDDGASLPEAYLREFAEAVIGRLADDYLGAVAAIDRAMKLIGRVGIGDKPMAAKDAADVQEAYRVLFAARGQ